MKYGVLACMIILIPSCDDAKTENPPPPGAASLSREVTTAGRRWLEVKDDVSPELWLASRELAREADDDEPTVKQMANVLYEADRRYYEGPRMIANRSVQVEEMLAENGIRESARSVIEGLSGIAELEERAGFGETCQHYVMARIQGSTRKAALETLRRNGLPKPDEHGGDRR